MNHTKLLYLLLLSTLFLSCAKTSEEEEDRHYKHVVFIYMSADNNLGQHAINNIIEMQRAWNTNYNGKIVLYLDTPSYLGEPSYPRLIEIHADNNSSITSPTVKSYPEKNSSDPNTVKTAINDMVSLYSADKYTLILWSHGTGWLPANTLLTTRAKYGIDVKSFGQDVGQDVGQEMDIKDLAASIPPRLFGTIIFDACFMGGVELMCEFQDKADVIIASPAEILAKGFPYNTLTPLLFEKPLDPTSWAAAYFDYYNGLEGQYQSATIGVIDLKEFKVLTQKLHTYLSSSNVEINTSLFDQIQTFDQYNPNLFFDFEDFIERILNQEDFIDFKKQLDKTVLFSAHTNRFINYDIIRCCGLSCYLPFTSRSNKVNDHYKGLSWYNLSGINSLYD